MTRASLVAAVMVGLVASVVSAQTRPSTALPMVEGGKVVFDSDLRELLKRGGDVGKAEVTEIGGGELFKRGWRVKAGEFAGEPYRMQVSVETEMPLKMRSVMLLEVWVRGVASEDETSDGRVELTVEQSGEPYGKDVERVVFAGKEWRQVLIPFEVKKDYSKTGTSVGVRFGFPRQTVEFGGVKLYEYGVGARMDLLPRTQVSYEGREENAAWRKEALERIEKIRKGKLKVTVVDEKGAVVPGANVKVEQTKAAFEFGGVYHTRWLVGQEASKPDAEIYRKKFLELFNVAVDEWAMKWRGWDQPVGKEMSEKGLAWMMERGIPVRGHTMVWPSWRMSPEWVKGLEGKPEELREAVKKRIREVGTAFKGKVVDWDVVNEPYTHNDILKILGRAEMVEWFKAAREVDPKAKLFLNEAGQPSSEPKHERYGVMERDLQMLLDKGAPVDGIGMQGHFAWSMNSPVELLGIYDRFAKFGLPIKITELDVSVSDEQLQADYFRDVLISAYSHPSIDGVLIWGFWEGMHWRPVAALYRKDWSIKPVGQVWVDWVLGKWRTNVEGSASGDGVYVTRAFFGEFLVNASGGGKSGSAKVVVGKQGGRFGWW